MTMQSQINIIIATANFGLFVLLLYELSWKKRKKKKKGRSVGKLHDASSQSFQNQIFFFCSMAGQGHMEIWKA